MSWIKIFLSHHLRDRNTLCDKIPRSPDISGLRGHFTVAPMLKMMKDKENDKKEPLTRSGPETQLQLEICAACGHYYPVRDDIINCPVCGSDLKSQRSILA